MLKAVKAYAVENGLEAQISLEERMACGIGACLACVCKTVDVDTIPMSITGVSAKKARYLMPGRWNFDEYKDQNCWCGI